jgi:hypothetical protein
MKKNAITTEVLRKSEEKNLILTVGELMERLKKHDPQTEICSGYWNGKGTHCYNLYINEEKQMSIGDRDAEEDIGILLFSISMDINDY